MIFSNVLLNVIAAVSLVKNLTIEYVVKVSLLMVGTYLYFK